MALEPRKKRDLMAAGHTLKPSATVGEEGPSPELLAHLSELLERHKLVKVRIQSDDRDTSDRTAEALVAALGCNLVRRIGRVALLYRAGGDEEPR
jgi:RNA-binding protein